MSTMSFLCPGMLRGVREDAPDAWMRKPSMRRSLAAAMDLDVQSFAAQFTAEMLPAGFDVECIRALTSGGHSTCHTSAGRFAIPDVHTPPAPRRHASVYPK
eukprot:3807181-Ditylum_brightwellii.AAC.1